MTDNCLAKVEVNSESVGILSSMGYDERQCTAALMAANNDIERAADWLFSHMDDINVAVDQVCIHISLTTPTYSLFIN